ncbi:MAG: 4Fe-4S dicluster domain-containing protein [Deltaproteobacteria bacterium]|nr:4Fe-4S dicluster domain-containing protein [Deltaproteobacteria bacterium]
MIVFDPYYCSGCMRCMTACSTFNNGATSLFESRIQILRHEGHAITGMNEEDDLIFDIATCLHCDDPYCVYPCPSLAIERNADTGAIVINHDKCVGCRMCLVSCPFGAISYDTDKRAVVKCELCNGDPQCVRFCPTGALKFMSKKTAHLPKKNRLARRTTELRAIVSEEKAM